MASLRMKAWRRVGRVALIFLASVSITVLGSLSIYCLAHDTIHLFVSSLALAGIAVSVLIAACGRRKWLRWVGLGLAFVSVALVLWYSAPWPAEIDSEALVRSRHLPAYDSGPPWFRRIPEPELVRLGAHLGLRQTEHQSAVRLFDWSDPQLGAERIFGAEDSRVLDSWLFDRGHYWVAWPEGDGPFPTVVFLHGSGGNFQAYANLLAVPALKERVGIVFPTFGYGNWSSREGQERVRQIVDDVSSHYPVDASRVFVGGISAGGIGAIQALETHPTLFRGGFAISGLPSALDRPESLRTKEILVFHGALDVRFLASDIRHTRDEMEKAGAHVLYVEYPRGDHFILLTHRDAVIRKLLAWLNAR